MAKDRVQVPLTFELGWRQPSTEKAAPTPPDRDAPRQPALR
jgi:hypothetical protein